MSGNLIGHIAEVEELTFRPQIYKAWDSLDFSQLSALRGGSHQPRIFDTYLRQLQDLIKIRNPQKSLSHLEMNSLIDAYLDGESVERMGIWVYYPWNHTLIHLLKEEEFIELRTSRNLYKITKEEQAELMQKTVGIIGLSVGHSMAMNLVLERSVGKLKLADYDEIELSNLNRIKTNLTSIGLPKAVLAAREIAELDPFIEVELYPEGITEENIEDFLVGSQKLDTLIEECDGLNIKILSRLKAKEHGIPVLMETSDRGMIDVERFDLEPNRPILHGLIDHLDINDLKNLKSSEEKIPFLMPMVGIETMSTRLKASAMEVGNTLTTWPQLGTSVMLGGAVLADTYRRIMLNQFNESGRFIVDPSNELKPLGRNKLPEKNRFSPLDKKDMIDLANSSGLEEDTKSCPKRSDLMEIVEAAGKAPSGGNSQPWRFLSKGNLLYLFLDKSSSDSFMDYKHTASCIALGCCIENAMLKAESLGYKVELKDLTLRGDSLVAVLKFIGKTEGNSESLALAKQIGIRFTDRRILSKTLLKKVILEKILEYSSDFENLEIVSFKTEAEISTIGKVVSMGDRLRILHPIAHEDFTQAEMRWNKQELESRRDGISIEELELSPSDFAGLNLIKDPAAVDLLKNLNAGKGLLKISQKLVESSSVVFGIYSNNIDKSRFFEAGILLEKIWLFCTANHIGLQILNVPLAFILRYKQDDLSEFDAIFISEIEKMHSLMDEMIEGYSGKTDLILFRLFNSEEPKPKSIRKKIESILDFD